MTKTSLASTLAVAAVLLATPAAAQAATAGSELNRAPTTMFDCDERCTLGWGAEGWSERPLAEGEIVTSWKAHLAPGTRARLRILRRNAQYEWTQVRASETVTGSAAGGVQAFRTHLPVDERGLVVAVDVEGGAVGTVDDVGFGVRHFRPALGEGETRWAYRTSHELLVQATTEGDADLDGRGDATEDDCVFCAPPAGGGSGSGSGSPSGSGSGPAPVSEPAPAPVSPSPADEGSTPSSPASSTSTAASERPAAFQVDRRALLQSGARGRQGWADVYVKNDSVGTLDASIVVRAGGRRVGAATLEEVESGDATTVAIRLGARERRTLRRKRRLKLSLAGSATLANGHKLEVKQPLTVLTGGDHRYDGTYRGPGPFVMVVERGTIRTISSNVLAYCVETKRQMPLNIFTTDGFPALVARNGSFALEGGSAGGQSNTYRGKLSLRGTGKGYASAFRSSLMTSGGRYMVEGCTGATNWKVKRDR